MGMKPGHKLIAMATGLAVLVLLVTFLAGGSSPRKAAPPIAPIAGKAPTMTQSATLDAGVALVQRADLDRFLFGAEGRESFCSRFEKIVSPAIQS